MLLSLHLLQRKMLSKILGEAIASLKFQDLVFLIRMKNKIQKTLYYVGMHLENIWKSTYLEETA